MDDIKNQVEEIDIIGNAIKDLDNETRALLRANITGLVTGLKIGKGLDKGDKSNGV